MTRLPCVSKPVTRMFSCDLPASLAYMVDWTLAALEPLMLIAVPSTLVFKSKSLLLACPSSCTVIHADQSGVALYFWPLSLACFALLASTLPCSLILALGGGCWAVGVSLSLPLLSLSDLTYLRFGLVESVCPRLACSAFPCLSLYCPYYSNAIAKMQCLCLAHSSSRPAPSHYVNCRFYL